MMAAIAFLVCAGALAGFMAGLLGVGGGIVLVPCLFFLLDSFGYAPEHIMHIAVGTSLAVIVPTGISSARAHWRRGAVRADLVKSIGIGIVAGAGAGTAIADRLSGPALQTIFAVALLAVAAAMAFDPARLSPFRAMPRQPWPAVAGLGIGTLSTLMGIGGATISVPFMTACRVPIREAVGTASALGPVIALPAMLGFMLIGGGAEGLPPWSVGYVNVAAWIALVPASVLAAPWGARLAHSLPVGTLRRVFAAFMAVVALKMLAGIFDAG